MEQRPDSHPSVSRRAWLRWAVLAGAGLALSACGGQVTGSATQNGTGTASSAATGSAASATSSAAPSTSSAAPTVAPAQSGSKQAINLQIWQNWGTEESDPRTAFTIKTLLPQFAQEHPGLTGTLTFAGNGNAVLQKIIANVAGGTPPDVSFVYAQWTVGLGYKGAIIALDDLIARTKGFQKDDYYPHLWDALTYKNKIWGFPQNNHPFAVFYHTDTFQRYDGAAPKSWDDFTQLLQKMTHASDGQYAIDLGPGDVNFWDTVQRSNGGDYLSKDGQTVAWNSQAGLQALQYATDIFKKYQVTPPKPIDNGFQGGKIVMTIAGPWRVNGYLTAKLNLLTFPFPAGSAKAVTHANVDTWGILKTNTDRQQGAFDFVAWYSSKPIYSDWAIRFQHAPLTKSIAADPAYQKFVQETPIMSGFLAPNVEPIIIPLTPVSDQINTILGGYLNKAETGATDPLTALKSAESDANTQLYMAAQ